jgi:hypothetical protein
LIGLTGSVLFWRDGAVSDNFYSNQFPFEATCFTSQQEVDGSGSSKRGNYISGQAATGTPLQISHRSSHSAYAEYEGDGWVDPPSVPISVMTAQSSRISKRVPFLPGNLFCPTVGTSITGTDAGSDCFCYSDATEFDPDPDDDSDGPLVSSKRSSISDNATFSDGQFHVLDSAKMFRCNGRTIAIPAYQSTPIIAYYDLDNPASLDPTMGSWVPSVPVDLGNKQNGIPYLTLPQGRGTKTIYAREHPYETSMGAEFCSYNSPVLKGISQLAYFLIFWSFKRISGRTQREITSFVLGSTTILEGLLSTTPPLGTENLFSQ